MGTAIQLGQKVRDRITGLQGIAVGRTVYLQGCARICIQPPAKGSEVPDALWIDEPHVEIVGAGVSKKIVANAQVG